LQKQLLLRAILFLYQTDNSVAMKNLANFTVIATLVVALFIPSGTQAQQSLTDTAYINAISSAVPFLRISPDARAGGMGDVGIGVSPDANGWYYAPAKMAFAPEDMSLSVTYTPWLRQLVNDIYLASLYGYKRIDDMQTVGGSLRYFSLGNITFTGLNGQYIGEHRPNEFAIDAGYSRKLSDVFSAGIMLKFIYSNLASGQEISGVAIKPGTSAAADISFYYHNDDVRLGNSAAEVSGGVTVSNLGAKITYTDDAQNKDFLPANIGIGGALKLEIDQYNDITFAADLNKLMVPAMFNNINGDFRDLSVPSSIIQSFSDAPGGFKEELREIIYQVGLEYWYDKQFALRAGYFYEHGTKGGRNFATVGVGLKYNVFGLNFSYLIPTTNLRNPLDNTLRFSLNFDFEALAGKKEDTNNN
jgi:hypothetical protein